MKSEFTLFEIRPFQQPKSTQKIEQLISSLMTQACSVNNLSFRKLNSLRIFHLGISHHHCPQLGSLLFCYYTIACVGKERFKRYRLSVRNLNTLDLEIIGYHLIVEHNHFNSLFFRCD